MAAEKDEEKKRKGRRPRDEVRTRLAKARVAREAAIIGDLRKKESRDCVFRNRQRLRAEVLVYVLRQQLRNDEAYEKELVDACSDALFGKVEPGADRPRAAVMVRRMVSRAFRYTGLPMEEKEIRRFVASARELVWKAIVSEKPGDLFWQERFGMRMPNRLVNLVKETLRENVKRGAPGRAQSLESLHPQVILALLEKAALENSEDTETKKRFEAGYASLKRAVARLPHPLPSVYEIDAVGRLLPVRDAAQLLGRSEEMVKKYRQRARELLNRDHVLRAELRDAGFRIEA